MPTTALDHVNILTDDLEATIAFYEQVLELKCGESPGDAFGFKGAWLFDASGHPIVHLVWNDPARDYGKGRTPGSSTNAVHHVAFRCQGFVEAQARIAALGFEHRINDGIAGLRQIVLSDPNAITVEMNFPGD
jgi:catechol 2,3-dioxygenase-like lactoylglutathione lyase family enzyme